VHTEHSHPPSAKVKSVCDVPPFSVTFTGMLLQSKDKFSFSFDIDLGHMDINETLCDKKVQIKLKHNFSGFYFIALNPTNS
jgi:hypothetical protein